jgi:hypothetical protein
MGRVDRQVVDAAPDAGERNGPLQRQRGMLRLGLSVARAKGAERQQEGCPFQVAHAVTVMARSEAAWAGEAMAAAAAIAQ